MKRTLLPLLVFASLAMPAAAQNRSRPAPPPAAVPMQNRPAPTPPPPTPPPAPAPPAQPGICCCRVWSHGWQYSWRPNAECTTQNGSCVTPDHC